MKISKYLITIGIMASILIGPTFFTTSLAALHSAKKSSRLPIPQGAKVIGTKESNGMIYYFIRYSNGTTGYQCKSC